MVTMAARRPIHCFGTSIGMAACLLSACGGGASTPTTPATPMEQINGIAVPPDPGAQGKATLLGVDANGNGVRDDVERVLAEMTGTTPAAYQKGMLVAKLMQTAIATTDSAVAVKAMNDKGDLVSCATSNELKGIGVADRAVANTKARQTKVVELYSHPDVSLVRSDDECVQ